MNVHFVAQVRYSADEVRNDRNSRAIGKVAARDTIEKQTSFVPPEALKQRQADVPERRSPRNPISRANSILQRVLEPSICIYQASLTGSSSSKLCCDNSDMCAVYFEESRFEVETPEFLMFWFPRLQSCGLFSELLVSLFLDGELIFDLIKLLNRLRSSDGRLVSSRTRDSKWSVGSPTS
ncbi:hypothetical protein TrVGV298_011098 [Trichoderma virens]|nr:hypothetical protein TrVGV298_011098 [Trichoderma virens]